MKKDFISYDRRKNEIREVAKYSNDFNAVPLKDFFYCTKKDINDTYLVNQRNRW